MQLSNLPDFTRIFAVLAGSISQVVCGGIPFVLGWKNTISTRSYEAQTLVTPAGYAFVIWNVLFLGCFVFAVIHSFPKNWKDPNFRKIGWLAALTFFGNSLWEVYVPLNGFDVLSIGIILVILISLIVTMYILKNSNDKRPIFIPLMLLGGWISVATFVNISVTAKFLNFNPFALSPEQQAIIVITAAGIVTTFFAHYFKSPFYNACTLWGLFSIYVINNIRGEYTIAYLALILGIAGFLTAILGKISFLQKLF